MTTDTTTTTTTTARRRIQPWPIVVDSREQQPLPLAETIERLNAPFTVERGTLACGDYALRDFPDVLCVERKNLAELVVRAFAAMRRRIEQGAA